ncbi:hypothetical protein LSUE1_G008611 [Lachnellula suecica]|uniref:Uncharacterized protein n=1 Tax=Lachnellula suecica TaxID=602035 RepID=A0A8T9BYJ1_9HELO|nr:hypothetical protein LSUE1_G008611 [Lachnellula suecica]
MAPIITPGPDFKEAAAVEIKDFTVPDYLEGWYWYGRLVDGCSCIITSAAPSITISATETDTLYTYTTSTTFTSVYTIYPFAKK